MTEPHSVPGAIPPFLARAPVALQFGTSGLRGRVCDMTDLEVYINTRGFMRYLLERRMIAPGQVVALAEDLRVTDPGTGLSSSPRIARAVARAVRDAGCDVLHCGRIPTPALACFAMHGAGRPIPCIMVTGSHIPADRNGIKFYGPHGEVLKHEEPAILAAVARCRAEAYARDAASTPFDAQGMFQQAPAPEPVDLAAEAFYRQRYVEPWSGRAPLRGLRVVHYQHSAVGRDLLARILADLGAEVIPEARSDVFVPIDTEDVKPEDEARYRGLVTAHRASALVATDGDGDRPLIVDETGRFHGGDVVGLVTAALLDARLAAVPVTASDALERHVAEQARTSGHAALRGMEILRTRIGSPHVVAAMQRALAAGAAGVVGWEANGGFLTGSPLRFGAATLAPLPTRDAVLPILAVLLTAARQHVRVSEIFAALPQRATRAGLLDDFAPEISAAIMRAFRPEPRPEHRPEPGPTPGPAEVMALRFAPGEIVIDTPAGARVLPEPSDETDAASAPYRACRDALARYFSAELGFGAIQRIDYTDGVRVSFAGGDVAHLRPSGNAPQLRIYAVSDTRQRADAIVALATAVPDGLLQRMARDLGPAPPA
jgi:phosphomannomutase